MLEATFALVALIVIIFAVDVFLCYAYYKEENENDRKSEELE